MDDFNTRPADKNFRAFYEGHDLFNLIKDKNCFKSASRTCIDLIFTNRKLCFKITYTIDSGISDFHRMTFTQLKLTFEKLPLKTIVFRDYKTFTKENFDKDLLSLMFNTNVSSNYAKSSELFEKVLDKYAPLKKRKVRGNQMSFTTKTVRKSKLDPNYFILLLNLRNSLIGKISANSAAIVLNVEIKRDFLQQFAPKRS